MSTRPARMSLLVSRRWQLIQRHLRIQAVTMSTSAKTWPFASIDASKATSTSRPRLEGIVFDVDGTLCLPQNYMFKEMRDALGITKATDILEYLNFLTSKSESEAKAAWEAVKSIERRAMAQQTPQPGLAKLMNHLDARSMRRAIVTRNFDEPVAHLLTKFLDPISGESKPTRTDAEQWSGPEALRNGLRGFNPILTRSFTPAKPAPDPLLHIAQRWGLPAEQRCKNMIMVGDSKDDVESGKAAGAFTVVLGNNENEAVTGDWRISSLLDLVELLEG